MKRLIKNAKEEKYIGFIGFSSTNFNEEEAKKIINSIFEKLDKDSVIVSGATNIGIPKLVYEKAKELGMKTVGIMCNKGYEYDVFPVDKLIIEGENWGDESKKFLFMINELYKIGGGKQSDVEFSKAKEMGIKVKEYML